MEKVRIGNDIQVKFTVYRNGEAESFIDATGIQVIVRNEAYNEIIPNTYSIFQNIVTINLDAINLTKCGKCRVILAYHKGSDFAVDSLAFELVEFSSGENGTVAIDAVISVAKDGKSAYEVWEAYPGNEGKTIEQYFVWLRENPTKVDTSRTIAAGNGLTGGGSLTEDITININTSDDSVIVDADGIKVDTQDILTSTSTTKPLSAAKGKVLQDNKVDKTITVNGYPLNTNVTLVKADVGLSNVDNTSDVNKPISTPVQNALNLKADLVGGKIPTSQLPSYVDDVLEYANSSAFPATGETGKIYVALDTNLTYRWSGTDYVEISKSLGLGETSSTAYRGDRGKTAYDHSQATGNVHGTTASQIPNTPAGTVAATTVQGAINELAVDIVQVETDLNEKLEYKADLIEGTVPAEQLPPDLIRTTLYLTQVGHRKRRIQDSLGVEDGNMLWTIVSGTEYLASLPDTLGLGLYLVSQDLTVYKKLSKTNSTLYADGTPALLDGTDGDIQMCWRKPIYIKYYEKQEADGLYEHIEISHLNILGECEMIVPGGGFPAVLNRTTGDLRALYSTDPNYRGGNNTASYDSDPVKTLIGKPATNLSAYSGEVAAKKRGALWTTGGTPFFATLAILQIMLFGTNHAQDDIVSDDVLIAGEGFQSCKKNANGLYSGGFGVNNSFTQWSTYNDYNPTFDLSAGFSYGDITGRRVYIIKDWPTVGTNQTISLAYFFGMPYPFNHYWHGDAHQRIDQQTEAQGFKTVVYQKRDITTAPISGGPSANGVVPPAPWEKVAEASRTEGYIRRTSFNSLCLIPTAAGSPGSSNKFYPDYFYNNGATSFGWRAPLRFAILDNGASAGPFYVNVSLAPTDAYANFGAFCCHFSSGTVPKKLP